MTEADRKRTCWKLGLLQADRALSDLAAECPLCPDNPLCEHRSRLQGARKMIEPIVNELRGEKA